MSVSPTNYQGVMVSSTFVDLKEHRKTLIDAISNNGFHANTMEYSGAAFGPDVLDKSLQMVRESVAYMLIIGHRYGECPEDAARNADNRSITELEFDEAVRLRLPILLFVISDSHPVTKADGGWETNPDKSAKLEAFIARAKMANPTRTDSKVERVWESFESVLDFARRAATALGKLAMEFKLREALAHTAEQREVSEAALRELASKVSGNVHDLSTAIATIEEALSGIDALREQAKQGTNLDELIGTLLFDLVAHNSEGRFAEASAEVERTWQIVQSRKQHLQLSEAKIVEIGIEQARAGLNSERAAYWICQKILVDGGKIDLDNLLRHVLAWREPAVIRGLKFELDVSIELAELAVNIATDDVKMGRALTFLALVISDKGERVGGETGQILLDKSVTYYEDAIKKFEAENSKPAWANTQVLLGAALSAQGERTYGEVGLSLLDRSVAALEAALVVYTEKDFPLGYAGAKNNIGSALRMKAERTKRNHKKSLLRRAINEFNDALRVSLENFQLPDWAVAQCNLGSTFHILALCTKGAGRKILIEQASAAFGSALMVQTKDLYPVDWARTQNNLGGLLVSQYQENRGRRSKDLLDRAIAAFEFALSVRTEQAMPVDWAMSQSNLGVALWIKSQTAAPDMKLDLMVRAKNSCEACMRVYTQEHTPYQYKITLGILSAFEAKISSANSQLRE